MAPPTASSSSRRYSGAITTAASPLQGNFELNCRSPVRPSYDDGSEPSRRSVNGNYSSGPFLQPPRSFPFPSISTVTAESRVLYENDDGDLSDDDEKSLSEAESQHSATDETWFLQEPQSPSSNHARRRRRRDDDAKLGVFSAVGMIVGKTVGVGAYSVPSAIFSGVGSVGMTLTLWAAGSLISFCGLAVYLDLGTALPRSGGERVYLERIFRRPHMLATCMFMAYTVLLGFSAPNAIVLGEYALYAVGASSSSSSSFPSPWAARALAVAAVTLLCWVHAAHPRAGLRLVNALGAAKMLALLIVVAAGAAGAFMGVGSDRGGGDGGELPLLLQHHGTGPGRSTAQRNFSDVWAGTSTQPYDYATALLKVVYCFRGYGTANQVLSEVRDPVRTLRVAAPAALALVSLAYISVSVAFFLVVDKDDLRSAGVIAAGVFFRNVFGPGAGARVLSGFVVLSAANNIAATSFAQARVNEELARDGLLPFSKFWTTTPAVPARRAPSRRPSPPAKHRFPPTTGWPPSSRRGSPTMPPTRGLLLHWLVSVLVIVLPPPGRIYDFLVDIGGYPVSVISAAVSLGLLYLHLAPSEGWATPCRAPRAAVLLSALSNALLLVLPWVPPRGGRGEDGRFAYYAYPATALGVLGCGAGWWAWWRTREGGGVRDGAGRGHGRGEGSVVIWSVEDELKNVDGGFEARGLLSARRSGDEDREEALRPGDL
ncbi:Amino acid transporter [Pleurostoma richardsiae]|uniref:Amino acid transporter n=1 Tax=Pleurostoma richardsiae TaxID=41990 RepID=A0AA38VNY7_9PEZI|nr:Amino acid transporter [Pleurostoma richardsiae]